MNYEPDENGYWGEYGGRFVPETLVAPLDELTAAYFAVRDDAEFHAEFDDLLRNYSGRPTPLYLAKRLTETLGGAKIYLKREDLNHTGAHKINNCIGQILLARRMGKKRIIAETGAGAARRCNGDGLRIIRPRVRRVYGHRRHEAARIECVSDASARGRSSRG